MNKTMENWGYIKFNRGPETNKLLRHPNAFVTLTLIALRARRTKDDAGKDDVEVGEALIGDWDSIGLTRGEGRTALNKLEKLNLITKRTTSKGTIAKVISTGVYDINLESNSQQLSQQQFNKKRKAIESANESTTDTTRGEFSESIDNQGDSTQRLKGYNHQSAPFITNDLTTNNNFKEIEKERTNYLTTPNSLITQPIPSDWKSLGSDLNSYDWETDNSEQSQQPPEPEHIPEQVQIQIAEQCLASEEDINYQDFREQLQGDGFLSQEEGNNSQQIVNSGKGHVLNYHGKQVNLKDVDLMNLDVDSELRKKFTARNEEFRTVLLVYKELTKSKLHFRPDKTITFANYWRSVISNICRENSITPNELIRIFLSVRRLQQIYIAEISSIDELHIKFPRLIKIEPTVEDKLRDLEFNSNRWG